MLCSSILAIAILSMGDCQATGTPTRALDYEALPVATFVLATAPSQPRQGEKLSESAASPLPDVRLAQIRGGRLTRGQPMGFFRETTFREMTSTVISIAQQQQDNWWATTGAVLVASSVLR